MAYPTAVNDVQSNKLITTPISEAEVKESFKKIQSKDSAGPITSDVLVAFVQYVTLQISANDPNPATDTATQVLNYLQGYDGANKSCTVSLTHGSDNFSWGQVPANAVSCGWQQGCIGGLNQTYGLMCQVTWD